MPSLTAVNGPESGKRYELASGEYILGRHPDCNIVIDVGAVSRHHCKVFYKSLECFVEDLRSRNGTFVNDVVIDSPHRLRHGDQIRVCDVVFNFNDESTPSPNPTWDDSSFRAVMVDDDGEKSGSTIMSKMDITGSSKSGSHITLIATPEAKLDALMEIMQSLGKALSLDEVLRGVLDSLFRIFVQADRGFIGLLNDDGALVPRWTKLRRQNNDETIRVSRTIAKQVMDSREAILSADAASDERFDMSQSIADFRIRSMMCAPLISSEGHPLGVLQIDTMDQRQRFQDGDLDILVSAATQSSIAIDNAQLHEEALAQQSLKRDLKLASDVQQAFLPDRQPEITGYDFFDYYQAANQVGGDYYDYVALPDGKLAIIVADVVGHGVAAAMLMAKLSAEARYSLASESDAGTAFSKLNARLCNLQIDRFVTVIMVVLDPSIHEVSIVNAGHMAPIYRHADGSVDEPGSKVAGIPMGIVEERDYEPLKLTLEPGESLTMYTDGLPEAADMNDVQYGIKRLKKVVEDSDGSPLKIGQESLDDVRRHMGAHAQDDDMCLVVVRRVS